MWLVLANTLDPAGPWLTAGLSARTFHPVLRLTELDLGHAQIWEHVVGRGVNWFRLQLADGRWIDSREVSGVINRLHQSPFARMAAAHGADHLYAVHEIAALLIAALAKTDCLILNSPGGHGLNGNWRRPMEWLSLAAAAGFSVPSPSFSFRDEAMDEEADETPSVFPRNRLLIIAENVIHADSDEAVPESVRRAALKLASVVQDPLLELHFIQDDFKNWIFHRALPSTDLLAAGDAAIDAIASLANRRIIRHDGQFSSSPFLPEIAAYL
ncbi:MAG TPA: hypothetical protein VHO24_17730 [Opitutaceae bacterium]|nr:hypothetical protein [Opitutaceae bacterium]